MACPFHQHGYVEIIFCSMFFGLFSAWFALLMVGRPIPTKFLNCVQD
jgi:hypothetical protein